MSLCTYRSKSFLTCLVRSLLLVSICILTLSPRQVQAGNGPIVKIPLSVGEPTIDGVCSPSEYGDAAKAYITLGGVHNFPVFMKHTAEYAYFCFGDESEGLLPQGNAPQVAVYIDRENDGYGNESEDDFGVFMNVEGESWARYWGTSTYNGEFIQSSEYQAAIQRYGAYPDDYEWQVEFRLSRALLGGWKRTVGLALFYHHWWWVGDDYSWPTDGIWASPQWWANGYFTTGSVMINSSDTPPVMDGQCGVDYADATVVPFSAGANPVTAYMEHSEENLYVCLQGLSDPADPQGNPKALLHLDRSGVSGGEPGINDFQFSISYDGNATANAGDGSGFTAPIPVGEYDIVLHKDGSAWWSAEFRVSASLIGRWYSRFIGIAVSEQDVMVSGDFFGWPEGYSPDIPNTWGAGYLLDLGTKSYLPVISR